jgi:hypothetical protein
MSLRAVLSVVCFASISCAHVASRPSHVAGWGYDRRCPEGLRSHDPVPSDWQPVSLLGSDDSVGGQEIVYQTPEGRTTWCNYSAELWERQKQDILARRPPATELLDETRRESLARAIDAEQRRDENTPADERTLAELDERFHVSRRARPSELGHQSVAQEKAVLALAGVLLARASTKLVASAELCVLEAELASARATLARERRVAEVSGVLDEPAAHRAGVEIVEASERIADVREAIRDAFGSAPRSCDGGVKEAARCRLSPGTCADAWLHERAWDAATIVLSVEPDIAAELETRAKQGLPDEWMIEAERRAAAAAAELSR